MDTLIISWSRALSARSRCEGSVVGIPKLWRARPRADPVALGHFQSRGGEVSDDPEQEQHESAFRNKKLKTMHLTLTSENYIDEPLKYREAKAKEGRLVRRSRMTTAMLER